MSKTAPYIALAIDWWVSDQFDDASHGQRLAWVMLLCYGKAEGTGRDERKVSWNPERFAKRYRLDPNAARGMVDRAVSDNAVRVNGDELVILNWGAYQERWRRKPPGPKSPRSPPSPQTETETETKKKARRARAPAFAPPGVAEVAAYCRERGNSVDAQRFVDHYTANGWKVGGKGNMRDWRAAVRTWEGNGVSGKGKGEPKRTTAEVVEAAVRAGELATWPDARLRRVLTANLYADDKRAVEAELARRQA